ncbi:MAG: HNH endonuclease [Paraburkholderia sp.]|uniref:HNH endonuclease n=1 Tax=Paraburkholderia sp. TaxID=1926495 RepID=UPI003C55D022
MKRLPPLTVDDIRARLSVDMESGRCYWVNATKYHSRLNGQEAGSPRKTRRGNFYWVIKINGNAYKRAQLVLMLATGRWPVEMVDHDNGNTLDDRSKNLRHASATENAQNHRTRAKKSPLPMGVRQLPNGKFQARITCNKKPVSIGVFESVDEALVAYKQKRKEVFHAFSGL